MRCIRYLLVICTTAVLTACGGGGGSSSSNNSVSVTPTPSGANVQALTVNGGPNGNINLPMVSIQVCETGSTVNCKTIDNIVVDTGSTGLRVLASVLNAAPTPLSLTQRTDGLGNPLLECVKFADASHVWGPVQIADVKISGETAGSVNIQAIGNPAGITEPATCSSSGSNLDTVKTLGANGILGVGFFAEDCGGSCSPSANQYFSCPLSGCVSTGAQLLSQVQNPVARFSTDNNGVIIQLPAVAAAGAPSVNGYLIFGIDTQSNNALGTATVITVDSSTGYLGTTYNGTNYPHSFLDSGSNGFYFPDPSITQCTTPTGFYCPSSTMNLSAKIIGANSVSSNIAFSVADASAFAPTVHAADNLAGASPGTSFDWGLPFFFGRKVYTANEGPQGIAAPYVAF